MLRNEDVSKVLVSDCVVEKRFVTTTRKPSKSFGMVVGSGQSSIEIWCTIIFRRGLLQNSKQQDVRKGEASVTKLLYYF